MGNYDILEIDFIKRTLNLLQQYDVEMKKYNFEERFNHTLLINCLLGLVVLPNEKILKHLPKEKIPVVKTLQGAGIKKSTFDPSIKDTKDLIRELRDSVAHFNIKVISDNDQNIIDRIQFINDEKKLVIAEFISEELWPFVEWFAQKLIKNFETYNRTQKMFAAIKSRPTIKP